MTSPKRISTDLAIELVFREAKMTLRDEQAPPLSAAKKSEGPCVPHAA
jgi:hypothetical protein